MTTSSQLLKACKDIDTARVLIQESRDQEGNHQYKLAESTVGDAVEMLYSIIESLDDIQKQINEQR